MKTGWIATAKDSINLANAARGLGLDCPRHGMWLGPCPGCGRKFRSSEQSEKEGKKDKRGACAINETAKTWKCYTNGSEGCGAGGSVVDLVGWVRTGRSLNLDDAEQVEVVKAWCEDRPESQPNFRNPLRVTSRAPKSPEVGSPPPAEVGGENRRYMTAAEVEQIWAAAGPIDWDLESQEWLKNRGISGSDLDELSRSDAVRVLPANFSHPACRHNGVSWGQSDHRLITRGWLPDPPAVKFTPAGIHARYCGPDSPANGKKGLWAAGFVAKGLCFALHECPLKDGLSVLRMTVTEGVGDFMVWATRTPLQRGTLIGFASGGFTEATAEMVPAGWNVVIRDHADAAGDKYTQGIAEKIAYRDARCWRRSRFVRSLYKDDGEALLAGQSNPHAPGLRLDSLRDAEPVVTHEIPVVHDEIPFLTKPNKDGDERILQGFRENTKMLLDAYKIQAKYCRMRHTIRLVIPEYQPSVEREQSACIDLMESIAIRHGLSNVNVMRDIRTIAKEYHPVADWIDARQWDGTPRLRRLFDLSFTLAEGADAEFCYLLFKRWMLSAAYATLPDLNRPTFTPQGVLVLQGPQGIQKSQWILSLFPAGTDWVAPGMQIDPENKDSIEQAVAFLIVEIGELDGVTKRVDHRKLKAFITKAFDVFRTAYAKSAEKIPRRTIFAASVNPQEFLVDDTGNRRFWPLPVTMCNPNHGLDMQQLWAEVAYIARSGEVYYLSHAENQQLAQSNRSFERQSPIAEELWEVWEPIVGIEKLMAPRLNCQAIWGQMPSSRASNTISIFERNILQKALVDAGCQHATKTDNRAVYAVRKRHRPEATGTP